MVSRHLSCILGVALFAGCAAVPPYDYTAFKESRPRSILVLPPINKSPDVAAGYSVLSQATRPLAEAGYYVMPVSLVAQTFQENGMSEPTDMHAAPAAKLRAIFGADAALYITVLQYGTLYQIINSESIVAVEAELRDLKSGRVLWNGHARASSSESNGGQSGDLAVALIAALIKQVLATSTNQSHKIAGIATQRLLYPGPNNGLLYGPRSPHYGKD